MTDFLFHPSFSPTVTDKGRLPPFLSRYYLCSTLSRDLRSQCFSRYPMQWPRFSELDGVFECGGEE